jgi:hypothetical protein
MQSPAQLTQKHCEGVLTRAAVSPRLPSVRSGHAIFAITLLFQSVYCSESMPVLNRDATKVKIILTTIQYVFRPMSDSFQVST